MKQQVWVAQLLIWSLLSICLPASASDYFPAPVAVPQLLVYYDFSRTDFYSSESQSLPLIAKIMGETYEKRLNNSVNGPDLNEKIAQYLRNKPNKDDFKIDKLFLYLKDKENFALILTGSFDHEKIKALYNHNLVTDSDAGTIIDLKIDAKALPNLCMFVSNELIMLAANTTIEAYADNLNQGKILLTGEYQNFIDMVNASPMLAAELSVMGIKQRLMSDNMELPAWVQALKHIRLIVDRRLTRLQLAASSDKETNVVRSGMNEQLLGFDAAQNFYVNEQNSSIFIEAKADSELEMLVAHHTAAFILHFFVKAELETTNYTSEVEHAAR